MKILISGATGMVGSALCPALAAEGHEVWKLVRKKSDSREKTVQWDIKAGSIEKAALEGIEGVMHLAGENIGSGRWTAEKKRRIRDSRVNGTRLLSEAIAGMSVPPQVMVCASAVGYYGSRGDEILTEDSAPGQGFLADVCKEWEAAADPARKAGIRVVHLRFGMILSPEGGALAKMLPIFKKGLGGPVGNGRQYWSWVALDDVVEIIDYALLNKALNGPVNAVAPDATTNREFTKTLAHALGRPAVLPLPALAARLALGEMADATLLTSARVKPARLLANGYVFRHQDLDNALRHLLDDKAAGSP